MSLAWALAIAVYAAMTMSITSCTAPPYIGKNGVIYEDPESYRVDPNQFPKFQVKHQKLPPDLRAVTGGYTGVMPLITPDDIWQVKYKKEDYYLIFSETYHLKLCQAGSTYGKGLYYRFRDGRCTFAHYLFHIWITRNGEVVGNWMQIENPSRVFLKGDRATIMSPVHSLDRPWGAQPLFIEAVEKINQRK